MGNQQIKTADASEEFLQNRDVSALNSDMRRKLGGHGRKYNLRVIIKGERNTGKTCLWKRLQGEKFPEEYIPTPEIQSCHINWGYKTSNDIIKVEVWDVVDQGKSKRRDSIGLKLDHSQDTEDDSTVSQTSPKPSRVSNDKNAPPLQTGKFVVPDMKLDAESINVYKGTHCVILMMDPTKRWTFEYLEREIPKIPENIFVLVLVNYSDMANHRTVEKFEIEDLVHNSGSFVKCLECSMLSGFGMRAVVSFFNLPFLQMQRFEIQKELEINASELELASKEFNIEITKEQNRKNLSPEVIEEEKEKENTVRELNKETQNAQKSTESQPTTSNTVKQENSQKIEKKIEQKTQPEREKKVEKKIEEKPQKVSMFSKFTSKINEVTKDKKEKKEEKGENESKNAEKLLKEMSKSKKQASENIDDFNAGELDDDFFGDDDNFENQDVKYDDESDDENQSKKIISNPKFLQYEDYDEDDLDPMEPNTVQKLPEKTTPAILKDEYPESDDEDFEPVKNSVTILKDEYPESDDEDFQMPQNTPAILKDEDLESDEDFEPVKNSVTILKDEYPESDDEDFRMPQNTPTILKDEYPESDDEDFKMVQNSPTILKDEYPESDDEDFKMVQNSPTILKDEYPESDDEDFQAVKNSVTILKDEDIKIEDEDFEPEKNSVAILKDENFQSDDEDFEMIQNSVIILKDENLENDDNDFEMVKNSMTILKDEDIENEEEELKLETQIEEDNIPSSFLSNPNLAEEEFTMNENEFEEFDAPAFGSTSILVPTKTNINVPNVRGKKTRGVPKRGKKAPPQNYVNQNLNTNNPKVSPKRNTSSGLKISH